MAGLTSGSMMERGLSASTDEGGLVSRGGTGMVRDMLLDRLAMSRPGRQLGEVGKPS